MHKTTSERDREYLHKHMKTLPYYVQKFIRYKERKLSPSTLRGYSLDFEIFFRWLLAFNDNKWNSIDKIPLSALEKLRVDNIEEDFLYFLSIKNEEENKKVNKKATINRKISALKSLFYYLGNIAEDENLNPLLYRNVMAKIELEDLKLDKETLAQQISSKILLRDEIDDFRAYVAGGYEDNITNKLALRRYKQNKERDTAIISLILSSGLRINEVANITLSNLNMVDGNVEVIRKGEKERIVSFSSIASNDLREYLKVRNSRYKASKKQNYLFLTLQQTKEGSPMTKRAMQLMIEKYSKAFGKPKLKAHGLRHSFATRFYQETNNIAQLKKILGHESIETTMIYTHVFNNEIKDAIEMVDRQES